MFALLAAGLAAGVILGRATGGRLSAIGAVQFRLTWLAIGSAAVALLPLFIGFPSGLRATIQILTMLGILAFLVVNIGGAGPTRAGSTRGGLVRAGLVVIAFGWALNFIVIASNGAMPLSLWAYEQTGQGEPFTPGEDGFFKIEEANEDTILRPLGDVIPVPMLDRVLSVGDIFLLAGVVVAVAGATRAGGHSAV